MESAIKNYKAAKAIAAEYARELEKAEQAENSILGETDSDVADAAERLVVAEAVVPVLAATRGARISTNARPEL